MPPAWGGASALAAGPLVGGLLIATVGWRSIFFINVPLCALGWWLTARDAAETAPARDRGVDLPGQLIAVAAAVRFSAPTPVGQLPQSGRSSSSVGASWLRMPVTGMPVRA
jgi:DHA2 family methylenomycin A resistance protein-like MFS transporter